MMSKVIKTYLLGFDWIWIYRLRHCWWKMVIHS